MFGQQRSPDNMRAVALTVTEWQDILEAMNLALEQHPKLRCPETVKNLAGQIQKFDQSLGLFRHLISIEAGASTQGAAGAIPRLSAKYAENCYKLVTETFERYRPPGSQISDVALGIRPLPPEAWAMIDELSYMIEKTVSPEG